MKEQEYEYHTVTTEPGELEIKEKQKDGWERCCTPEGVMGRDLVKESNYPHSLFYFKRKKHD